ncbi:MAG: zf-HC2 domain-containing protein [Planctomycetes bacterium]|nr:zf-HC2 domain-containing protein [Planctomycetota bacterium]
MIQGETNPPERKPRHAGSVACEKARARMQEFLGGDQPLSEDRALRVHLERCETCNAQYRESLLFAARIARERRRLLENREARGDVVLPVEAQRSSRLRRFRAIVMPLALIAALGALFSNTGVARRVAGRLLEGRATTAGRVLDDQAARDLLRGEWLVTDPDSRVALESEGTRLELQSDSQLLVEEPRDLRFRMRHGQLTFDGPCSLRGEFGAIECRSGAATLTVSSTAAALESSTAELEVVDSSGTRRLGPGGRLEFVLARR